jgi:ankyrin repeat protein
MLLYIIEIIILHKTFKTVTLSSLNTYMMNDNPTPADIFELARNNKAEELKDAVTGVDINATDSRGSTPLIIAAYHNNAEAAKVLLDAGAATDLQDSMGNTALMGVCFKGYTAIAELLLQYNASVDLPNGNGATALSFAATFNHAGIIRLLIEHGADKNLRDRFGKSPVDYARIQENIDALKILAPELLEEE